MTNSLQCSLNVHRKARKQRTLWPRDHSQEMRARNLQSARNAIDSWPHLEPALSQYNLCGISSKPPVYFPTGKPIRKKKRDEHSGCTNCTILIPRALKDAQGGNISSELWLKSVVKYADSLSRTKYRTATRFVFPNPGLAAEPLFTPRNHLYFFQLQLQAILSVVYYTVFFKVRART